MKRVSFKVAKALKEAGYPQDYRNAEDTYTNLNGGIWVKPTYIEVWLWLWRKKKCPIDVDSTINNGVSATIFAKGEKDIASHDPEEAIIAAIEYLVDNDLIK